MKISERLVDWKKTPSDPRTHDQWNSTTHDMMIRKINNFEFQLYRKGQLKGTWASLEGAKNAAERYAY